VLILLDNAFTHTADGSRVALTLGHDGGDAIITVADSGPGFNTHHLQRIFDRFYRTDGARARSSGGTGLGLAIAQWIAEIHGGSISADSEPGEGSTFTVRFPGAVGEDERESAESESERSGRERTAVG
ncbi:MAG: sensor histidine kinase, partial [Chloroflexota bacterium]